MQQQSHAQEVQPPRPPTVEATTAVTAFRSLSMNRSAEHPLGSFRLMVLMCRPLTRPFAPSFLCGSKSVLPDRGTVPGSLPSRGSTACKPLSINRVKPNQTKSNLKTGKDSKPAENFHPVHPVHNVHLPKALREGGACRAEALCEGGSLLADKNGPCGPRLRANPGYSGLKILRKHRAEALAEAGGIHGAIQLRGTPRGTVWLNPLCSRCLCGKIFDEKPMNPQKSSLIVPNKTGCKKRPPAGYWFQNIDTSVTCC